MEDLLHSQFIGTNELRKHLTRLLENLREEGEDLVITKQGKPLAVVLDVEKYLEIQEALREFSDPAYLAQLLATKNEFAEGKGIPAEEVYKAKGL